jgi:hypothetical protein
MVTKPEVCAELRNTIVELRKLVPIIRRKKIRPSEAAMWTSQVHRRIELLTAALNLLEG